jgi:hypothetical protein
VLGLRLGRVCTTRGQDFFSDADADAAVAGRPEEIVLFRMISDILCSQFMR